MISGHGPVPLRTRSVPQLQPYLRVSFIYLDHLRDKLDANRRLNRHVHSIVAEPVQDGRLPTRAVTSDHDLKQEFIVINDLISIACFFGGLHICQMLLGKPF